MGKMYALLSTFTQILYYNIKLLKYANIVYWLSFDVLQYWAFSGDFLILQL